MPTYIISGYLTISAVATVTAPDEKTARQKALALGAPSLCHHCASAGEGDPDAWTLNGFDDPPDDVVIDVRPE